MAADLNALLNTLANSHGLFHLVVPGLRAAHHSDLFILQREMSGKGLDWSQSGGCKGRVDMPKTGPQEEAGAAGTKINLEVIYLCHTQFRAAGCPACQLPD